ncbi:restriction endonuclease subunit S [Campylobacter jejuni]|uniref:restriction endonuclease subunit S n=1 Tax=Campylobacter jejuni TaxID=197 RepID=UPI0024BE9E7E|nr:restriction endonuclease subunit S [Campylobacter jejuni]
MINLLQGWEWKSLGEIFNIERGGSPRPIKEFLTDKEDGINWIKIGDIKNQKYLYKTEEKIIQEGLKKSKLVIEGDLLVSNSMSFGKPVIVKLQKGAIHDGWLLLKEKINLNKEYFYYLFSSNFMYNFLSYQASGSTVKNLNIDKLKQIEIPLPPLKEQERIVGILDESFAKIDESIKILEQDLLNLDELMQSALQKAFNPLKDNAKENYKLPQGWEWKSLGEISNLIQNGFAASKNNEIPSGYVHLRTHNISTDGNLNFDTLIKIKREFIKEKQSFIEKNDILFNNTNSTELVGKTALVTQNYNYAFSNHLTKIKLKNQYNSKLVVFYFVLLLKNKYFEKICHQWIGQSGINIDKLKKIQIPLPPLKEQEQIAEHLDFVFEKAKALKELYTKELKDYEELKQSLLDKAFKGEL